MEAESLHNPVAAVEAGDVDAEYITLAAPTQGSTLRVTDSPFNDHRLSTIASGNLLSITNVFGWAIVANESTGFSLFSLESLRSAYAAAEPHSSPKVAPHLSVPTSAPVMSVAFAMSDKIVLVAFIDGSLGVWRLKNLVEGQLGPQHMFPTWNNCTIVSIYPCPAPSSPIVYLMMANGALVRVALDSLTYSGVLSPDGTSATAACWSVKGKQIAIGCSNGEIRQYAPDDPTIKAQIPPPALLAERGGAWIVQSLDWLENNVFLVTFGRPQLPGQAPGHEDEVLIATRSPDKTVQWTSFQDPAPAFGMMTRPGRRWTGRFRSWSPCLHLLFVANAPSTDLGVVGLLDASTGSGGWASLALSDSSRPSLPLGPEGQDVSPLGLDLDLCGEQPAIWVLTSQGVLVCWRVGNEHESVQSGSKYAGMRQALDVRSQEDQADVVSEPTAPTQTEPMSSSGMAITPVATPFTAPKSNPFAVSTPSATTSSTASGAAPAFGSSAFGGGFASGATPAFGSSAFGASPSPAAGTPNAFTAAAGTTTATTGGFAGFGSATSSGPSAGSGFASFGSVAPSSNASPFGSGSSFNSAAPTFGKNAFGSTRTSSTATIPASSSPASTPAHAPATGGFAGFGAGAVAAGAAFGSFAASAKSTTTSSASPFGTGSAFGDVKTQPTTPSPFGSGTAFGSTAPAFGQSAFGAAPAAATSKPANPATAAAPTTPSFGGFSAFGAGDTAAKSSPSGFGSFSAVSGANAFASVPATSSPFSSSPGGGFGSSVKSAFGAGGTSFGAATPTASTKTAFSARAGTGADSDDEGDNHDAAGAEPAGRVDEPPDLEPTQSNLDLSESMRGALGSQEKVAAAAAAAATSKAPTTSAFGFGGLGLGGSATTTAATSASSPAPTNAAGLSIFGSAAAKAVATTPPAKPSLGFSFGTSSFSTPTISQPTSGPAVTTSAGAGAGASAGFSFGSTPAPVPTLSPVVKEATNDTVPPALKIETRNSDPAKAENETKSSESKSTPVPVSPAAKAPDSASTKSLFGFASSPPKSPSPLTSISSRLASDEAEDKNGKENDTHEGDDEDDVAGEDEEEEGFQYEGESAEHEDEVYQEEEGEEEGDEEEGEGSNEDHDEENEEGYEDEHEDYDEEEVDYGVEEEELAHEAAKSATAPMQSNDQEALTGSAVKTAASASPSLFSRLSPAPSPAAPKPAFSFAAAPTSTSAESFASTAAPAPAPAPAPFSFASSEVKPAPPASVAPAFTKAKPEVDSKQVDVASGPSFGGFGSTTTSSTAPKNAFAGFGSVPASKSPFTGFGAAQSPASTPSSTPISTPAASVPTPAPASKPDFSFASAATSTPAAPPLTSTSSPPASSPVVGAKPAAPANFFGFSSAAPKASSPLAASSISLAPKASEAPRAVSPLALGSSSALKSSTAAPVSGGFSFASSAKPAAEAKSVPGSASEAKAMPSAAAPVKMGPSLAATSTPKLGSQLVSLEQPLVKETGMAGEFLKAYLRVETDFKILRENAAILKSFVSDIGQPYQVAGQEAKLDDRYWSLGDLARLREETAQIAPAVRQMIDDAQKQKRQAAELQSLMLKAETKREEAARFIRARSDPEFAKMVRLRQLGPEQVENQKKIRHSIETVRTGVEQLENHLAAVKDEVTKARLGRSSFKTPSIDSINRAVRNITVAVTEKTYELDELTLRLNRIKLQPTMSSPLNRSRR